MASQKLKRTVILFPAAVDELHEIWRRNAEHCSPLHADEYVHFLKTSIYALETRYAEGRALSTGPTCVTRSFVAKTKATATLWSIAWRTKT